MGCSTDHRRLLCCFISAGGVSVKLKWSDVIQLSSLDTRMESESAIYIS